MAVHVGEHGLGTTIGDGVAGGHKGQGLGDHQIALLDAGQFQSDVQRCRAVHCGNSTRTAGVGDHVALEAVNVGANAGDEGGVDGVNDVLSLATRKDRGMQRDEV